MKRLLFFLLLIPSLAFSQGLKISQMQTYTGNPNGGFVPVVIAGQNKKVDAVYFGYKKVDSASVAFGGIYDTTYYWKAGTKAFYTLTRASGGGGSSAWTDITGKPTTLSGYGITDAAASSHTHAFSTLTSKPTTLSGYGITDAAALTHSHAAADVSSGVFNTARLGSGTASSSTYLRGDGSWQPIAGGGTGDASTNTSSSVDGEIGLFSGTGGKTFKRATVSGLPLLLSGVLSALAYGANGTYLKIVSGAPAFVSDSASTPIDGTLSYSGNVLGVSSTAGTTLFKSTVITSSSYSVAADVQVVFCNYTGGTCTITLPTASTYPDRRITIKNISSNNVSIANSYSGDPNTMVQYDGFTYQSIGGVWYLLMKK